MKFYFGQQMAYHWRLWGFTFKTQNKYWFIGISREVKLEDV